MKTEDRKLIKFSNYSLCVTLPKWIIKDLGWKKGDVVKMTVDEKKGEILIRKNGIPSSEKTKKPQLVKLATEKLAKTKSVKKSRW